MTAAVVTRLQQLEQHGNAEPRAQYNALKSHADKRAFAIKLSVGPTAAFCKVTEERGIEINNETDEVEGDMALWEVAQLEGLEYCEGNMMVLRGLVEDCNSKPHPKPALAAQGHLVYDYKKLMAAHRKRSDKHSIKLSKERGQMKNGKNMYFITNFVDSNYNMLLYI